MNRPGARRYGYGVARNVGKYFYTRVAYDAAREGVKRINKSYKPKSSYKKKNYYDAKARQEIKDLRKKVKDINQSVKHNEGKLIYRFRGTGRVLANANECTHSSIVANSISTIETVLAQLRYYDPTDPANLVNASGVTGTFSKDFMISKSYYKLLIQNNYQIPCNVVVYICKPKEDTSISPTSAFSGGLVDVGNPSNVSCLVYLTDSEIFQDLWKIEKSEKKYLYPGEICTISHGDKKYDYDPSLVDTHSLEYQDKYKSTIFVIRVEGPLAHDSAADEQGTAQCGIDYQMNRTFQVDYDAGAPITWLVSGDSSDTFTNGAIISSKPVADNISYSVN